MNKIISKCVLSFCLILCCFIFASCDLSHKHYFNDYGRCRNCNANTCITLTKDPYSNTYTSPFKKISTIDDGYFNFTSNGENGILINFTKNEETSIGETRFKTIKLYSENTAYIRTVSDTTSLEYDYPLNQGVTYYIYLDIENYAADIMLTVSELNAQNIT